MTMELFGEGSGAGEAIYARATIVGEDAGRPTLNPDLLTDAYRRFKRGEENSGIILVACDAATALLLPLPPGLTLAGVIAERVAAAPLSSPLPFISGVENARERIGDGDLVILDPVRGRVFVEPPPEEIARLQALRRRPRLRIAAEHTNARTQSGRSIDVWAIARDPEDVDTALENGADGILVVGGGSLLRPEDADAFALLAIAERMGGGDMEIVADPDAIAMDDIFTISARATLRWAVRPESLYQGAGAFREEMSRMTEPDDPDADKPSDPRTIPALAACIEGAVPPSSAIAEFDELLFFCLPEATSLTDVFGLPPFRIVLDTTLDGLEQAVVLGAVGVAVPPVAVGATKDFVREQAY